MRIFDNTVVPQHIIPFDFQPVFICSLHVNSNTVEIYRNPKANSGYYYSNENLTLNGTGIFCTNSRERWRNKTVHLKNAQELKVYYRPSSITVH